MRHRNFFCFWACPLLKKSSGRAFRYIRPVGGLGAATPAEELPLVALSRRQPLSATDPYAAAVTHAPRYEGRRCFNYLRLTIYVLPQPIT